MTEPTRGGPPSGPGPEPQPAEALSSGGANTGLTSGAEIAGPGADAGVTSGSRATATGANLAETQANDINPANGSESRP